MIEEATQTARTLVNERYPQARAAWLGGSVARGAATPTSDLDITVLLDTDGSGAALQASGKTQLQAGPPALTPQDLAMLRYKITDLIEDLIGADSNNIRTVVASLLWQDAATLLLTGANGWGGTGKGLLRELQSYDATHHTDYATALPAAVRIASTGSPTAMITTVDSILEPYGGRLFDGFQLAGD